MILIKLKDALVRVDLFKEVNGGLLTLEFEEMIEKLDKFLIGKSNLGFTPNSPTPSRRIVTELFLAANMWASDTKPTIPLLLEAANLYLHPEISKWMADNWEYSEPKWR